MRLKAENLYHGTEKYNCAQAIIAAFRPEATELIAQQQKFGGGRAENNLCGALHAALILETDELNKQRIIKGFESVATSVQCRTIRSSGHLTCKGCVGTAADLLEQVKSVSN